MMTLEERGRARCGAVARVVSEAVMDRAVIVTATRSELLRDTTVVVLRLTLGAETHVHDGAPLEVVRRLGPVAYSRLRAHAQAHFAQHIGTDPWGGRLR